MCDGGVASVFLSVFLTVSLSVYLVEQLHHNLRVYNHLSSVRTPALVLNQRPI
jgi:uncharacterized membrane protein